MIDLLKSIIVTITSVINFLAHAIKSLWYFIKHIPQMITFLSSSLTVLPTVLIPFALATISVYAVFFILNKQ